MKTETIEKTLRDLFEKYRIVFWYDDKKELREAFQEVTLPGVKKIEMQGDEFAVKHTLVMEEPSTKFLVFQEGEKPPAEENWMLDLNYCCGELRTDKCSLVLHELGLPSSFSEVYQQHSSFFRNGNKEKLKQKLSQYQSSGEELTEQKVQLLLLSICVKAENAKLDTILHELFSDCAKQQDTKYKAIEKANLTSFLWYQIQQAYGYQTEVPKVKDFVYHLFISCFNRGIREKSDLKPDSIALLHSFRDSSKYQESFKELSEKCSTDLHFHTKLQNISMDTLGTLDYCKDVDQIIMDQLLQRTLKETVSKEELQTVLENRRHSVWYSLFKPAYKALEAAVSFFHQLHTLSFSCTSFSNGFENYTSDWFTLDQLYRLYNTHAKNLPQEDWFAPLTEKMEHYYINKYLVPVNASWQKQVDTLKQWKGSLTLPLQTSFYHSKVEAEFQSNRNLKHVVVIVSDALRYEAGWELYQQVQKLDKVKASIHSLVGMVPSYTQLGMASLLPGTTLTIDDKGNALRDGKPTNGTENRKNILQEVEGTAIKAEEFLNLSSKDRIGFLGKYKVVYIYQNKIDAIAHKQGTESQAFEAVRDTIEELLKLVRKLITSKRSNILVTADHGFLYQQSVLDETDFNTETPSEETVWYKDRRFLIAPSISSTPSICVFTSQQLGLQGEFEVAFPKSITRFRLQGSCSRFVHGGTSLQEMVIPVVKINYSPKREGAAEVEYNLDANTSSIISVKILVLNFSQMQAVGADVKPVQIKAELVAENGEVISDSQFIIFDSTSEQFSQRRKTVQLTLSSASDKYNNQNVYVVLSRHIPNTSTYTEDKRIQYTLKRTIDFDF